MSSPKDVIRYTLGTSDMIVSAYVGDLSDDDFHAAPFEGGNPIAWQLGHILVAERSWVEGIKPGSCPPLPEGFAAAHAKETSAPSPFPRKYTRDDYLTAWKAQRAATTAVLDGLADEQLDGPSGVDFAPTVATLLNMAGIHALMHAGQFVALRRKLGKPVVI
jgi:uncharacterized damage-inducible protein DinB